MSKMLIVYPWISLGFDQLKPSVQCDASFYASLWSIYPHTRRRGSWSTTKKELKSELELIEKESGSRRQSRRDT